ncbi:hypothetical protein BLNAU_3413 [Blattamonas nauphoetae]|uniref:Uncharacterized protein n=1 Tax=Blattamonas nauphoetae TaxID=2049346 RepID=A0ABQ9YCX3_9EUKA|nr:hypothetical protein BLNAU_3413 [Blattamonas nauphoetae]
MKETKWYCRYLVGSDPTGITGIKSEACAYTTFSLGDSCSDTSAFLNWSEDPRESEREKAVVFRSLVATVKSQPALDVSVETKAVKFLESVDAEDAESADAFLGHFASFCDNSLTDFTQSVGVLISSASHVIATTALKMVETLMIVCSPKILLALVKADLIPQIINTLNPYSISFERTDVFHHHLMNIIHNTHWLASPEALAKLEIKDPDEQQAVHEMVLKQVLAPSEKYIWHLCENSYSIVDGRHTEDFMSLLAHLLQISPSYQPTMDFILHMPVVLTIPSCLAFLETESSLFFFLYYMDDIQREWNEQSGAFRRMGKTVLRMLRMEGIEDAIEQKLQNDRNGYLGGSLVGYSIEWNKLLGMNAPQRG